jgi:hypothetical protein
MEKVDWYFSETVEVDDPVEYFFGYVVDELFDEAALGVKHGQAVALINVVEGHPMHQGCFAVSAETGNVEMLEAGFARYLDDRWFSHA